MHAAAAAMLCLALLRCAADDSAESTPPATGETPPASVTARLEVSVVAQPGAEPRKATLECGAAPKATGFIVDAAAACRAVAEHRVYLLDGPPADRACTMIYGGPQVATVTGTIDGRPVKREIRRTNGCGIHDWSTLEALLGRPPEVPLQ